MPRKTDVGARHRQITGVTRRTTTSTRPLNASSAPCRPVRLAYAAAGTALADERGMCGPVMSGAR